MSTKQPSRVQELAETKRRRNLFASSAVIWTAGTFLAGRSGGTQRCGVLLMGVAAGLYFAVQLNGGSAASQGQRH